MDILKYLERIKFDAKIEVSKEVLFTLHKLHLLNIPFENLDIHYGKKIELELEKIFQKIVIEKRGGFCYELNSIFNQLLSSIGFKSYLISGRVYSKNIYGKEFDHMAIIVSLDNILYLVDVGFGKFIFEPLMIKLDVPQKDHYGIFIIDKFEGNHLRVNKLHKDKREPEYIFTLKQRKLNQFSQMCNFHQTSSDSHFTEKKIISLAKFNGRISLTNKNLKKTHLGKTKTINFKETEFENYLYNYFGIKIIKNNKG